MARRVIHFIALVVLVLGGPARAMFGADAPRAVCCCGEANPGQDLGPCGMPKAPCAPRCPHSGASQAIQAPILRTAEVQAARIREAGPRREPAPWPAAIAAARTFTAPASVPASHGPPGIPRDLQAGLCQFRI